MNLRIDLNEPKIINKVTNDRFGLFIATEEKRVIDPFTPRNTGQTQDTARLYPWRIHYITTWSEAIYNGSYMQFQKKNPYSTYEWDIKAMQAGQFDKLYRTANNALQSGKF